MAGMWFEDFQVGAVISHGVTRTVTEADNTLFSCLTMNPQPLHIDHHFASGTNWGRPLVNSIFTLGVMIGIAVPELTLGTTIANLGMEEVVFPAPVFHGDTLHAQTEIKAKRPSRSQPGAGIVTFIHRAYNQNETLIAQCTRQALMRNRPVAGKSSTASGR